MPDWTEMTTRQWNQFCNACMSHPVPLGEADLTKPFVYERRFGVFYTPSGMHQSAMSFLLALQLGVDTGIAAGQQLKVSCSAGTADYWLEHTPGAAFLSSVGKRIQVATCLVISLVCFDLVYHLRLTNFRR